ncbi:SRPBCC family protein [Jejudonia soesokkakensis]|uniref:SRPBCC family protein n=1 Tax=Jejudonia soesokkakensis TaxID=1323432 RepID=A0ABW2MUE1_9FLAO
MYILTIIGMVVAIVVVAIILLALIAPKKYHVERSMIIKRPVKEIYKYLRFIKNQDEWSPWKKRDPEMKQTYIGTDGEVGFISKWDSNHKQVGSGEQEIKFLVSPTRIDSELRFFKPWKSKSNGFFILTEINPEKTEVTWGFEGTHKIPANVFGLFFNMDKAVGKDFEEGLSELKRILEN